MIQTLNINFSCNHYSLQCYICEELFNLICQLKWNNPEYTDILHLKDKPYRESFEWQFRICFSLLSLMLVICLSMSGTFSSFGVTFRNTPKFARIFLRKRKDHHQVQCVSCQEHALMSHVWASFLAFCYFSSSEFHMSGCDDQKCNSISKHDVDCNCNIFVWWYNCFCY